jgi:hypothetical protein
MFKTSLALSVLTFLVVLSFPNYFLYVPFQDGMSLFSALGFFALLGWVSLVVLPPVFFAGAAKWRLGKTVGFIAAVSLYTLSTVGVKVASLVSIGTFYADYLIIYPILIFIEWILPAFYIYVVLKQNKEIS